MKSIKNLPSRLSYSNSKKKRNVFVFDAGIHTLNMEMLKGESDVEFVNRFLLKYFEGCRFRGKEMYQDYFLWNGDGDDYIHCWGVKKKRKKNKK